MTIPLRWGSDSYRPIHICLEAERIFTISMLNSAIGLLNLYLAFHCEHRLLRIHVAVYSGADINQRRLWTTHGNISAQIKPLLDPQSDRDMLYFQRRPDAIRPRPHRQKESDLA